MPIIMFQAFTIKPALFHLNESLLAEVKKREQEIVDLENFKKPAKIIFTEQDPYLNKHVTNKLKQIFPNSELHLINSSAHYVQFDQPDNILQALGLAGNLTIK